MLARILCKNGLKAGPQASMMDRMAWVCVMMCSGILSKDRSAVGELEARRRTTRTNDKAAKL